MRKRMGKRPSPGLIVAGLALMVALGGTAVALPGKNSVDTGDIRKNAVKSKHIKNKQVKPADLNAKSRGPRAYAAVGADNDVDSSHSRGITDDMVELDDDFYCFYDLGFNPKHAQVTVDWNGVNGDVIGQVSFIDSNACDGEEQASVRLWDASANTAVPSADFHIAFFH